MAARVSDTILANPYGFPYDILVANVVTTGEARDALHRIAKRFDEGDGEPVYFGSHRRAQGVIVPVDVWEKLLEQGRRRARSSLSPTASGP
jgi:hypothetical protein